MIAPIEYEKILESARINTFNEYPGYYIDFMGVKTRIDLIPWAKASLERMTSQNLAEPRLPIPDDGYRSGAEAYIGLIHSVKSCESENFLVIELGAGYAPWVVSGLTYARRLGKKARGIAIEANVTRCDWAINHCVDNDFSVSKISINKNDSVKKISRNETSDVLVLQNAIWTHSKQLRFPRIEDGDMGARPEAGRPSEKGQTDYRGVKLTTEGVYGICLEEILSAVSVIDLLHVDLQGSEFLILEKFLNSLEKKVKFISLGTHSRLIEGNLQEMLLKEIGVFLLIRHVSQILWGFGPHLKVLP